MFVDAMIAFTLSTNCLSDYQMNSTLTKWNSHSPAQIVRNIGELYGSDFSGSRSEYFSLMQEMVLPEVRTLQEEIVDMRLGPVSKSSYKIRARIKSVTRVASTVSFDD